MEIYLDYSSTTPVRKEVIKEMLPYFDKIYGNPSSIHKKGREANKFLEKARNTIADILKCKSNEIIFTSGGTESVNLAIKGIAEKKGSGHIITTQIEHPAVLNTCKQLEKKGFQISYLSVNKNGLIDMKKLEEKIKKNTILISISYANNEIGTIQDIKKISKIAKKYNIPFHTDACQAAGYESLDVKKLEIDLMTINGSKIYAPKGIGILYKKENINLKPQIIGGGQEYGMRSGTENLPYIIGFSKALELIQKERKIESDRLIKLRDYFIKKVQKEIEDVYLNGDNKKRLPNNINLSFKHVEGEALLLYLDEANIYVSSGSACSSKSNSASHVLKSIGLNEYLQHSAIRFSLGKNTTKKELDYVIKVLKESVNKLRKISRKN